MRLCTGCDRPLTGQQTKWCSRDCKTKHYEPPTKTRVCEECKKVFLYKTYREKRARFCSRTCMGKVNARRNNAHHLEKRIELSCGYCKKKYGRSPSKEGKSKYCSRLCQNRHYSETQGQGKKNHNYKTGAAIYRQTAIDFYGGNCQVCVTEKAEEVHHKDADRSNADIRNLLPLCKKCHRYVHMVANRGIKFSEAVEACPSPDYYDRYVLPLIQGITKKRKEKRDKK